MLEILDSSITNQQSARLMLDHDHSASHLVSGNQTMATLVFVW
ncbi:MAG: hypothetical protein AB9873_19935 [Syntrophobacteraceae bacterium]